MSIRKGRINQSLRRLLIRRECNLSLLPGDTRKRLIPLIGLSPFSEQKAIRRGFLDNYNEEKAPKNSSIATIHCWTSKAKVTLKLPPDPCKKARKKLKYQKCRSGAMHVRPIIFIPHFFLECAWRLEYNLIHFWAIEKVIEVVSELIHFLLVAIGQSPI